MEIGDTIDCFVHRKGKRTSRERRAGSHVALIAYGVGITEILPMAMTELAKPEAEQVRQLTHLMAMLEEVEQAVVQ